MHACSHAAEAKASALTHRIPPHTGQPLKTGRSPATTATAPSWILSSAQSRTNTSTSRPAILNPCLTVWRVSTPIGPKGTFDPKGVGRRHTIRQGLQMVGREVEINLVDWAEQSIPEVAVAVLTDLRPLPSLVTMVTTSKHHFLCLTQHLMTS